MIIAHHINIALTLIRVAEWLFNHDFFPGTVEKRVAEAVDVFLRKPLKSVALGRTQFSDSFSVSTESHSGRNIYLLP